MLVHEGDTEPASSRSESGRQADDAATGDDEIGNAHGRKVLRLAKAGRICAISRGAEP